MAQWGSDADNAANSVSWVASSLSQGDGNADQATQNTNLFNNVTDDAFITGVAVGQFGVDSGEIRAMRESGVARPAAAGWVLRTAGAAGTGRDGRVTYETLVAMKGTSGLRSNDAADDTYVPDFAIVITTQPADQSIATGNPTTISVVATTVPTGGSLGYQWQVDTGGGFVNATGGVYTDDGTDTLNISNVAGLNGYQYQCIVTVTGGASVTSSAMTLTVT